MNPHSICKLVLICKLWYSSHLKIGTPLTYRLVLILSVNQHIIFPANLNSFCLQAGILIRSAIWCSSCQQTSITICKLLLYPHTTKLLGGILVSLCSSVCPSICLSVSPSRILCLLCSAYRSCWIYFIFIMLSSNFRRCVTCKVYCKISKF